jgi:hypothetical protein
LKRTRLFALPILAVSFFFWIYATVGASASGFFLDQTDVQVMVLGGAVSMVAAAVAMLWEG